MERDLNDSEVAVIASSKLRSVEIWHTRQSIISAQDIDHGIARAFGIDGSYSLVYKCDSLPISSEEWQIEAMISEGGPVLNKA